MGFSSAANKTDPRTALPVVGPAAPMIGAGEAMARLKGMIAAVAPRDCTVLIHGESGAGKELAARTIHSDSPRAQRPFVAVDCTGLRDTLLESQLFGHVKGAFTGADAASLGFIRAADGGTLFLDEIGEMELKTQAKLLRCIQERCVVPLGAVKPIPVNVRVLCATHRNLREMAGRGEFREDLLFRLDVVQLRIPALRERAEDILPLAGHFLAQLSELYGEPACTLTPAAARAIERYRWPGNVRELANALEHAAVFCAGGVIDVCDLPERVRVFTEGTGGQGPTGAGHATSRADALPAFSRVQTVAPGRSGDEEGADGEPVSTLAAMERILIERALRATGGNQNRAAALLDIERRRLYRKIAKHGLKHLTAE